MTTGSAYFEELEEGETFFFIPSGDWTCAIHRAEKIAPTTSGHNCLFVAIEKASGILNQAGLLKEPQPITLPRRRIVYRSLKEAGAAANDLDDMS